MTYNVSDGAAYAVLFSVLVVFTLLAMGSTDMLGFKACFPTFLGLQTKDISFLKAPT
jgi:hypothetical protein